MKKKIAENRKKISSEIGFTSLYKVFGTRVILHFFLITITVFLSNYLFLIDNKTFGKEETSQVHHDCEKDCCGTDKPLSQNNTDTRSSDHSHLSTKNDKGYERYLPSWTYLQKYHLFKDIGNKQFVAIILLVLSSSLLCGYFSSLLEKQISAESYFHLKNMLLRKLWSLDLEQKKMVTYKLKGLLENEIESVSELWEHLPTHFFKNVLDILFFGLERIVEVKNSGWGSLIFFLVSNLVFITIYRKLSNYRTGKYKVYRKAALEELAIVDKQISNAQLIENMGLASSYENLSSKQAEKTLLSEKSLDRSTSLFSSTVFSVPSYYRYLSLLFVNKPSSLGDVVRGTTAFFMIFNALKGILSCFKDYDKYKLACLEINNFLSLSERKENLEAKSIVNLEIEEILLIDVNFKYSSSKQSVLENYSRKFFKGSVNRITGGNGTGKTTILYLILGIIRPLSGKVLIRFSSGKVMNLHEEINLCEWREKVVAYLPHDNLIENGSTGQKQLENILRTLDKRKSSQIFVFDESANALDSEKQDFVTNELKKIVDESKIVILVQHKTNSDNNQLEGSKT